MTRASAKRGRLATASNIKRSRTTDPLGIGLVCEFMLVVLDIGRWAADRLLDGPFRREPCAWRRTEMVIFAIKLLNNVRKAIAGRRYPHQLAGGVALGVLLGIIPHGNLLAVFVLIGVLCFRVNHAMLGLVAIGCSFAAKRLDPVSHVVGDYLLTHPRGGQWAVDAWELPLVPWTDLNNTVVAGSFVIGLASVLPVFYLTLPFFKLVAPAEDQQDESDSSETSRQVLTERVDEAHSVSRRRSTARELPESQPERHVSYSQAIEQHPARERATPSPRSTEQEVGHRHAVKLVESAHEVNPPRVATRRLSETPDVDSAIQLMKVTAEQAGEPVPKDVPAVAGGNAVKKATEVEAVETRIDVIRMKDYRPDGNDEPSRRRVFQ